MSDFRPFSLTRRRFISLSVAAVGAVTLGVRPAAAASDTWVQNFQETQLWSGAKNNKAVETAPQWSFFKVLGRQEGSRMPVAHPLTGKKVYIEAAHVGPAGPPDPTWAYGAARPVAAQQTEPVPVAAIQPGATAPAALTPPPTGPVQGASRGAWVASFAPARIWTEPEGGVLLGEAAQGNYFKVLAPQQGSRLRVQDPLTSGEVYIEVAHVGPVGGPPSIVQVPGRWWGYVGVNGINVRSEPHGGSEKIGTLDSGTPVSVETWVEGEEVVKDQPGWAKLAEGVYVYGTLLRKAQIDTPPPMPSHGVLADRWIDVNLTQQTVTAYEGERPVYMTLTSSGRPGWETAAGMHSILWRKENETMESNSLLGRDAARADYRVENVRWTQYFTGDGQAIHENYWRDPALFGIPSSHGCLGMGAQDALWFWLWASPGTPLSVHY